MTFTTDILSRSTVIAFQRRTRTRFSDARPVFSCNSLSAPCAALISPHLQLTLVKMTDALYAQGMLATLCSSTLVW